MKKSLLNNNIHSAIQEAQKHIGHRVKYRNALNQLKVLKLYNIFTKTEEDGEISIRARVTDESGCGPVNGVYLDQLIVCECQDDCFDCLASCDCKHHERQPL